MDVLKIGHEFYMSALRLVKYKVVGFDEEGRALFAPVLKDTTCQVKPMALHPDSTIFIK